MDFGQLDLLSSGVGAICVLLIIFIIRLAGSSYLKKKGENLATKEDIKEITFKIEAVKAEFDLKNEFYKTYETGKRSELLCYYDKVTEFRYEYLAVNIGNFPMDDGQSLFDFQQKFHLQVVEVLKQYQRLVVYLEQNSSILLIAEKLTNLALSTDKVMRSKFPALKRSSIEESVAYAEAKCTGDKAPFHIAADKTDRANEEFLAELRPLSKEFIAEYSKYLSELNREITSDKPNT
ncbi:hypothetical protein CKQ84_16945 [Shewanella sp. WE21]|jgi:hypothetical protein|uniref:hypothetical protein n=1 Tax=Shewanella sp. WE21 TaxID=2029986 RepID=UPI000CF6EB8F|nr:hypothetical protein [Shewanella sp. WE21]AVI67430.1 hypothetical protein CKQ84_16945 [Shewanella sp. WE21]